VVDQGQGSQIGGDSIVNPWFAVVNQKFCLVMAQLSESELSRGVETFEFPVPNGWATWPSVI
jgi:hypothetical protein